jgi:hypothetical protein
MWQQQKHTGPVALLLRKRVGRRLALGPGLPQRRLQLLAPRQRVGKVLVQPRAYLRQRLLQLLPRRRVPLPNGMGWDDYSLHTFHYTVHNACAQPNA